MNTASLKREDNYFLNYQKDSIDSTAIYVFNTLKATSRILENKKGTFKSLKPDDYGNQMAYLYSKDTTEKKIYSLFYWTDKLNSPENIADTTIKDIPKGWVVSENGNLNFSEDGTKLYFGTSQKPEQDKKDTLLDDEKVRVDVWNWKDTRLQTQQLKELKDDQKKTYLAVIDIKSKSVFQIADESIENISTIQKGNSNTALGYSDLKYGRASSWEGDLYNDVYLIDLKKKNRTPVLEKCASQFALSPAGNYLVWYELKDSSWYCRSITGNKTISLTKALKTNFYAEETDLPAQPQPYGYAGWSENDKYILIYDKYDIWQIDPAGKEKSVCLTNNFGRNNHTVLRYVKLDREIQYVSSKEPMLLKAVNDQNKDEQFYSQTFSSGSDPKLLISGAYRFSSPLKSKNSNIIIWKKSNFRVYPDLWLSKTDFSAPKKISVTNPQQSKYIWGNVESVSWVSLKGEKLNGLLYKPENFDSTKKYPMHRLFL